MYASKELSKLANAPEPNTNMAQVSLRGSERAALQFADCVCVSIFGGVGTFAISRLSVSTLKPLLE